MKKRVTLILFFLIYFVPKNYASEFYVVMLSLDGFRWDYCEMYNTPHLNSIQKNGVKAQSLQASFPTKTFPNHYSIATGLYPGNHGIIANSFYDFKSQTCYSVSDRTRVKDPYYYKGEPIWVTAEKKEIKTASYYWIGSETPIKGIHPTYWKPYDDSVPFEARIDTVISWLQLPYSQRPKLITYYFDEPDGVGHKYGPNAKETQTKVEYLDSLVGVSLHKLNKLNIHDSIHFIVVSDHGMGAITPQKVNYLDQVFPAKWAEKILGYNPTYYIYPKKGYADSIYTAINRAKGLKAYNSNNLPKRFHLDQNENTPEIIALANAGWGVLKTSAEKPPKGAHGYDNMNKDMDGIFYATGPLFKKNYLQPSFSNVEIYNIICKILDIDPAPNDGKIKSLKSIFKDKNE